MQAFYIHQLNRLPIKYQKGFLRMRMSVSWKSTREKLKEILFQYLIKSDRIITYNMVQCILIKTTIPNILIGTLPLFWYPIKPVVLKDIYFHNVFVVTLFNPTLLFSKLNLKGIEFIKDERVEKYFIGKKIGEAMLKSERFGYFLYLIENCLHTEEAVISLI